MALKLLPKQSVKLLKRNKKEDIRILKKEHNDFKDNKLCNESFLTELKENINLINSFHSDRTLNNEYTNSTLATSSIPLTYSIPQLAMATYCHQYIGQPTYTLPVIVNKWSPVTSLVPTPVYPTQIPQVAFIPNTHLIPTQLCPYTGAVMIDPLVSTVVPRAIIPESTTGLVEDFYKTNSSYTEQHKSTTPLSTVDNQVYYTVNEDICTVKQALMSEEEKFIKTEDPLQLYLSLPRDLFPNATGLALDPNPIINEFCKEPNVDDHVAWILDLELGIPKLAITRAIPVYDVKFNSIHCKNTPSAIHPGFESCSEDFKRVLLFYYDCIISAWYRGYIVLNNDRSVENFQTWLLIAMQYFGMCWP